jgi:hypothetical protein
MVGTRDPHLLQGPDERRRTGLHGVPWHDDRQQKHRSDKENRDASRDRVRRSLDGAFRIGGLGGGNGRDLGADHGEDHHDDGAEGSG